MATARPRFQLEEVTELQRSVHERHLATVEQARQLIARTKATLEQVEADRVKRSCGAPNRVQLLREVEGLRRAMESRAVIEQAKGIIIASTGKTPDEAFDLLRQQSQHANQKLRELAADIVAAASRQTLAS
jgi:L-asparaginase/Glu-tRNA(Gln) amidotransferase subunit D